MRNLIFTIATLITFAGVPLPAKAAETEFLAKQYCQTTADGSIARMVNAALGDVVSIFFDTNKRKAWIERDLEGERTYQEFKLKFIKRSINQSGSTSYWDIVDTGYKGGEAIRNENGLALTYLARGVAVTSSCRY